MSFKITSDKLVTVEGKTITFTIIASAGTTPYSHQVITSISDENITATPLVPVLGKDNTYTCSVTVKEGSICGDRDSLYLMVQTKPSNQDGSYIYGLSDFFTVESIMLKKTRRAKNGEPKEVAATCFPGDATLQLRNGTMIEMKDLQLNDEILTGPGPDAFSPVYLFTHQCPDNVCPMIQLTTTSGASLCLTGTHYIYVNGTELRPAKSVHVGDRVTTLNGLEEVKTVDEIIKQGLFNPHTLTGDIMVNGIHTSTYTTALNPTLAHAILAPVRFMYSMGLAL
jgi:hypothetical protein